MKKIIIAVAVVLLFILAIVLGVILGVQPNTHNGGDDTTRDTQAVSDVKDPSYVAGLEALDNKDYVSASAKLKNVENDDVKSPNAHEIYLFAQSELYYLDGNKKDALETINKIPDEYKGLYSSDIEVYKDLLRKGQNAVQSIENNSSAINSEASVKEKIAQIESDVDKSNNYYDSQISLAKERESGARTKRELLAATEALNNLELNKLSYQIKQQSSIILLLKNARYSNEKARLEEIEMHESFRRSKEQLYNKLQDLGDKKIQNILSY